MTLATVTSAFVVQLRSGPLPLISLLLVSAPFFGTAVAQGKSQYHLFNPTPRELMREMSTDRPDKTESPYTVDAGHLQIEADILSYGYDQHIPGQSDTGVETLSIAPISFKLGLRNNVDLQLVVETYTSIRTHDRTAATVQKNRGFGDIQTRLKWNLWGNDGGPTALAVMPYAKFPSNQDRLANQAYEGGLIVPLAIELPNGFGMGLMTELDIAEDSDASGHHPDFVNTATVSRNLFGALGGYVEFFSLVSTDSDSPWIGTFDLGFTYALSDDIQLDAGVNIGLTRSAEDVNPFLGISWRL
jgi:hypothetical protein